MGMLFVCWLSKTKNSIFPLISEWENPPQCDRKLSQNSDSLRQKFSLSEPLTE